MDEEALIELVRGYEFLYNAKHPKYMDVTRKERAWKAISLKLNQPAAACKHKWQSLRDSYRRCLKKRRAREGQCDTDSKKWKFEDEMSFVAPLFIERKRLLTQDSTTLDDDDENSYFDLVPNTQDDTETDAESYKCASPTIPTTDYHTPQHDEIDRFFLNISETVKKFSPYDQALAKKRIFSVVSEMELQLLAPPVRAVNPLKQSPPSSSNF